MSGAPFAFAVVRGDQPDELVQECIEQLGPIEGQRLGFLYTTDRLANRWYPLLDELNYRLPGVTWVGTVGMGICAGSEEIYDSPALVAMVTDIDDDTYQLLNSAMESEQLSPAIEWCRQQQSAFALLHGDPSNPLLPDLAAELAGAGESTFVNGGVSASSSATPQLAGEMAGGGLSGVLLPATGNVLTDHSQGCTPIGPVHEITEAQRNVVLELDKQRALDVMNGEVGELLARDHSKLAGYIFAALPIAGSDTGDYLVRNLLGIAEDPGAIAVGDPLEEQSTLMFCRRDGQSARDDLERMCARLQKRLGERTIKGGVYISCVGRGRHTFGNDSEELALIHEQLGDFPLAGFFANGEIYNGRLYGYTGVLTLFV